MVFFSYTNEHRRLTLDTEPNYDFLGHPLNAYHFVRHVGNGWAKIRETLHKSNINQNETQGFGKIKKNFAHVDPLNQLQVIPWGCMHRFINGQEKLRQGVLKATWVSGIDENNQGL